MLLRLVALAFGQTTRIPVPTVTVAAGDARASLAFLPLVGAVVAGAGALARWGTEPLWGPAAATVVAVLVMVVLTGATHEDGFADTADGLWGGETPQRRLEILRDSRLGTYGVIALAGALAMRVALLAPLDAAGFARAAVAAHVLGRAGGVTLAWWLRAAAAGSGATVLGRPPAWVVVVTAGSAVAAGAVMLGPAGLAAALAALALVVVAVGTLLRRRLGGATGDGIGATVVAGELAVLAVAAALLGAGGAA